MSTRSFVTHLECSRCGTRYDAARVQNLCTGCVSPLLVRYDLAAIRESAPRDALRARSYDMWRYRELLPVDPATVATLGETMTAVVDAPRLGAELGCPRLRVKDEGSLPTGTFKARGAAVGVSRARDLGVRAIALPTAGNAGAAWAAYAARAGLSAVVVMPESTPSVIQREIAAYGATTFVIPGSIADAGKAVARLCKDTGAYDASTLKEPYRIEGKKTMAFELVEQLDWHMPDVIVYPTGGGVGLIAMWKAFAELQAAGWVSPTERLPRLVSVQSTGCAPVVTAFESGRTDTEPWARPETFAAGLRVPKPLGDFLILDALRSSAGTAVAVSDDEIRDAMRAAGEREGLLLCPEGAAGIAAVSRLARSGWLSADDRVILFNTGTGLKYAESLQGKPPAHISSADDLAVLVAATRP